MAMRCFGRARLAGAGARPLDLSFLRAVGLAAVLPAALLRAGDFFCWAARLAARDVGFFFLAIDVLPFWSRGKTLAQIALRRVGKAACPPPLRGRRGEGSPPRCVGGGRSTWWARRQRAFTPPAESSSTQCSRNTPSTARSSAGLISLECATVTANSGPSRFSLQHARKA